MEQQPKSPHRRLILKAAVGAAALSMLPSEDMPISNQQPKIKGINLGGWLVLEKWITPSLFAETRATDEKNLCLELGSAAKTRLSQHHRSFVTQDDFDWIASHGLNTVRIPIGYWIFGDTPPFVSGIETLDQVFEMATNSKLDVILDLHGAPGSQNGWDHSGEMGEITWHKKKDNITKTLAVIEELAKRYAKQPNLVGIELLNEPHWDVPYQDLSKYYIAGYQAIRKYCDDQVAVIIHDSFRPHLWQNFLPGAKNMILDIHFYQVFSEQFKKMNISEHLKYTQTNWQQEIANSTLPVLAGEWSIALDPRSLQDLNEVQRKDALQAYGKAQLEVFNQAQGWAFWTYKLENRSDGWNFRHAVETDLLPKKF